MRVLVVEDQKKTALFIRKALHAEGFAVDVAEDGETALDLTGSTPFDAIVLDIIFLYGTPTLVLLLVGGWFLMRRTLAPVTALTDAAERVHAENLRHRLTRSGNGDELDHLTGVFNDMLGRLDESFRRIRSFTLHASHELKTPSRLNSSRARK
jgi:PleD family two-component response regulator